MPRLGRHSGLFEVQRVDRLQLLLLILSIRVPLFQKDHLPLFLLRDGHRHKRGKIWLARLIAQRLRGAGPRRVQGQFGNRLQLCATEAVLFEANLGQFLFLRLCIGRSQESACAGQGHQRCRSLHLF